jgi:hypothetical protein
MVGISQPELDRILAGVLEKPPASGAEPACRAPKFRKFSARRDKKISSPSPCAVSQDELDRLLGGAKSPG